VESTAPALLPVSLRDAQLVLMVRPTPHYRSARASGIDDYDRLRRNELSRLPGVTRIEASLALRDVQGGKC